MKSTNLAIALNEKYTVMDAKLRKPPVTEDQLVEYKAYLHQCRKVHDGLVLRVVPLALCRKAL